MGHIAASMNWCIEYSENNPPDFQNIVDSMQAELEGVGIRVVGLENGSIGNQKTYINVELEFDDDIDFNFDDFFNGYLSTGNEVLGNESFSVQEAYVEFN